MNLPRHLVVCPADRTPDPALGQVVLVAAEAGHAAARLSAWQATVPVRGLVVPLPPGDPHDLLRLGAGLRVRVTISGDTVGRLDPGVPAHAEAVDVSLWAEATDADPAAAVDTAIQASLRGWPTVLPVEAWPRLPAGALRRLVEHYLHHPALGVPVEPLHGVLEALLDHGGRDLWHLAFGIPTEHFTVAPGGQVSLTSAGATDPTWTYGRAEDGPAAWRRSPGHAALRRRLGGSDPVCAACPDRPPCGGLLRALAPETACDAFREALGTLRRAAQDLRRLRRPG